MQHHFEEKKGERVDAGQEQHKYVSYRKRSREKVVEFLFDVLFMNFSPPTKLPARHTTVSK